MTRAEVLAKSFGAVLDRHVGWQMHRGQMIDHLVDVALAAQEGERGGAEVAAVEAERWEEGHTQGVIDYMNRHEPGLTPNDRLLRAVMLVDAWQANPYRADRIEAQP